jgi:hypothetical protein
MHACICGKNDLPEDPCNDHMARHACVCSLCMKRALIDAPCKSCACMRDSHGLAYDSCDHEHLVSGACQGDGEQRQEIAVNVIVRRFSTAMGSRDRFTRVGSDRGPMQ